MRMKRLLASGAAVGASLLLLSACGGSNDSGSPSAGGLTVPPVATASSIGDGEGEINILAWPGYAEDGSTDKSVEPSGPMSAHQCWNSGCQCSSARWSVRFSARPTLLGIFSL